MTAIDDAQFLHHVHVVGPESFEADFLLLAREKLRWKENVARVQRNCVRDAINTWLLIGKRPSLVRMIGKVLVLCFGALCDGAHFCLGQDMRHMIAGYIWRLRFAWPLPDSPGRNLTDSTNASIDSKNEQWQTIFNPPFVPPADIKAESPTFAPRRILKSKNRAQQPAVSISGFGSE